jgi:hypothetical protein
MSDLVYFELDHDDIYNYRSSAPGLISNEDAAKSRGDFALPRHCQYPVACAERERRKGEAIGVRSTSMAMRGESKSSQSRLMVRIYRICPAMIFAFFVFRVRFAKFSPRALMNRCFH